MNQFLAYQKNYLRIELIEKTAEYLAAPEDADLLSVQKATTTNTLRIRWLVGKGTDPIVLVCYYVVLIPMTSSFILG